VGASTPGDRSLRVICVLPLCLPVSLSKQPLTSVSAGALWVTKCYLKDDLRMFSLPRSDRPYMASQKRLGEESGRHWVPGIGSAAMLTPVALANRRTTTPRWISPQTGLAKPMYLVCTGVSQYWLRCAEVNVLWPTGDGVLGSLGYGDAMPVERR